MATPLSTGAVHLYGSLDGAPTTALYLGTCEQMPQDTRQPQYEPIMNDISGSKVPLDFAYEGAYSTISAVLTRMNIRTVQLLEAEGAPPFYNMVDVGSLMALEGFAIGLWLVYTFGAAMANKPAYVSQGLIPGRYYPQCLVWAPTTEDVGTAGYKKHLMFYAWPKYITSGESFAGVTAVPGGTFMLYSTAAVAFAGLNLNSIN